MKRLGKIVKVPLRDIWENEARDFTPWLAKQENLDLLSEELGLKLMEAETEVSVGSFNCDIRCQLESSDRIVVIENQIDDSNHEHLGKSIVYASGIDASIIIWIVKNARPEHASAIEWLNEHSDSNVGFFLVEIHAIKIGDSDPAPQFEIIEKPNEYAKIIKGSGGDRDKTRSQLARYDFWSQMNQYIYNNSLKLKTRKPGYDHWYDFSIGSSKYFLQVVLRDKQGSVGVGLNIWNDAEKIIFDEFAKHKNAVENILGELEWNRKNGQKSSWVGCIIEGFSYDNRNNWQDVFEQVTSKISTFQKEFKKYL